MNNKAPKKRDTAYRRVSLFEVPSGIEPLSQVLQTCA